MTTCSPATLAELSECLRQAHRDQRSVRVLGRADSTASDATGADIAISLARLAAPLEHHAGDLIATLPAGLTLDAANMELQREGQWLPLDPPGSAHMTIGALVAMNASGPRRHRFGAPRDLIIGIELALGDGRLVRAGGRVVKNVAGYDLARMMCGSYGSLAVITSATFKLSPIAAASRTVAIELTGTRALETVIQLIAMSPLTPAAAELSAPPYRVLARFESTAAAAGEQARLLAELCQRAGAAASVLSGDAERALWESLDRAMSRAPGSIMRVSVPPARVPAAIDEIQEAAAAAGLACRLGGRVVLGVLHVCLDGSNNGVPKVVERIRRWASTHGGSTVLEGGSSRTIDWGPIGDSWPVMQAVKARFDPHHLLNPGGGPGGL